MLRQPVNHQVELLRTSGFRARLAEAQELSPIAGFDRLLRLWFEYLPTIVDVALALEAAQLTGGDGADAYRDRMQDWWEGIRRAVGRLADSGVLAARWTPDRAADWVWTSVHPATYHHLVSERGWPPADVADEITGQLRRELLVDARS